MNVCPRCCKNTNGVHTCTPTDAWRELERQRDELLARIDELELFAELNAAKHHEKLQQAIDAAYERAAAVAESLVWKQHKHIFDGKPFQEHMHWEDIAAAIRELKGTS